MNEIVECVPNISEGRNSEIINSIVDACRKVAGVQILDVDPGADTNRTVITFAGTPAAVLEGAFQIIKQSAALIDMRTHHGAHPRIGACDVCPFVPVSGISLKECAELARKLGARVWKELNIPVYLYEHAASTPERANLSNIRKGEYEGLAEKLKDPDWAPDFGSREFNAKSGATVIGARSFLIAYNVNLNTKSKKLANEIAKTIRESGKPKRDLNGIIVKDTSGNPVLEPGLLTHCKAVGWYIETYRSAQVSINLTDFTVTGMHHALDACSEVAETLGLRVTGSELVGLVPKQALLDAGRHYLKKQGVFSEQSENDLIFTAIKSLGLSELSPFQPEERIIENKLKQPSPLASMSITQFLDELSSDSVAPGGGSVAALAGALAGALTNMVCALSFTKPALLPMREKFLAAGKAAQEIKSKCLKALDDDTAAFLDVMSASRAVPKDAKQNPQEHQAATKRLQEAYKKATMIPFAVAESAVGAMELAAEIAESGLQTALSDIAVAGVMAQGALVGAAYNVRINLPEITDAAFREKALTGLTSLESRGEVYLKKILQTVDSRLRQ